MRIEVRVNDAEFTAGMVVARGVRVMAAPVGLAGQLDELIARRATAEFLPPHVKEGVRQMLRNGGFRPSGRNKPASEYLAQAAREGRFPRINNLVDINNLVSLESGLPISMLDLNAVGEAVELRYGREGERYVFNATGQEIELEGLVCVCQVEGASSVPLGNPVKDSMLGKLKETTSGVIGIVYGTTAVVDEGAMRGVLERFTTLLKEFGGAHAVDQHVVKVSLP
jgi:DNA/RNA-binding domain of Phe-tRNA-synthetase-like protein